MFLFLFLDLEWKIIYVGSAESEEYDQILDSVLVGPVPAGRHMFVFQVSLAAGNSRNLFLYFICEDILDGRLRHCTSNM